MYNFNLILVEKLVYFCFHLWFVMSIFLYVFNGASLENLEDLSICNMIPPFVLFRHIEQWLKNYHAKCYVLREFWMCVWTYHILWDAR